MLRDILHYVIEHAASFVGGWAIAMIAQAAGWLNPLDLPVFAGFLETIANAILAGVATLALSAGDDWLGSHFIGGGPK